jgi:hypothetical protein
MSRDSDHDIQIRWRRNRTVTSGGGPTGSDLDMREFIVTVFSRSKLHLTELKVHILLVYLKLNVWK